MARRYFGTDGIRGRANSGAMTAGMALKVGMATGLALPRRKEQRLRVVVGKDTRLSGYMLETALVAGFTAVGAEVYMLGPMPTPAVAMLTRSLRADVGVMISASHNAFDDNGIKIFGADGFKLSDATEGEIEDLLDGDLSGRLATGAEIGRAKRIDGVRDRYVEFAKRTFPRDLGLDGLRVVVDCANGAAYRVAPDVLWELGAEVIPIAVEPDGLNINRDCGSTAPAALKAKVREVRADIGIALDGDADRVIVVDETGEVVDGDQLIAVVAETWARAGQLKGAGVVTTVMSNLGLERHLAGLGIPLHRTRVGDRHVVERMRADGINLGGEPSGHIIMTDYTTTGDGLLAALQLLAVVARQGEPVSRVCHRFARVPQVMRNVRLNGGRPLETEAVAAAIAAAEADLAERGRILVRASGTEPLIRVMAEGDDAALVTSVVDGIVEAVRAHA